MGYVSLVTYLHTLFGLSTLDANESRHGMDSFRQFVKLGVIA